MTTEEERERALLEPIERAMKTRAAWEAATQEQRDAWICALAWEQARPMIGRHVGWRFRVWVEVRPPVDIAEPLGPGDAVSECLVEETYSVMVWRDTGGVRTQIRSRPK